MCNFEARWLEESDLTELNKWWEAFRFPAPTKSMLPDNGKCGVMISKGDINICAGFIYFTNSGFALFEYVVSNFDYKNKDRKEALCLLYEKAELIAKVEGCSYLFSTVKNQTLINKMKDFGWTKGSSTTEMVKPIN